MKLPSKLDAPQRVGLLGHSQIGLRMNTYSQVIPAMQNEVVNRMEEILAPVAVTEENQKVN